MKLRLRVLSGKRIGTTHILIPPGGYVGSGPADLIFLPDESVAAHHAELRWDGGRWLLSASKGDAVTMLDQAQVTQPAVTLPTSGILKVGRISLDFWTEPLSIELGSDQAAASARLEAHEGVLGSEKTGFLDEPSALSAQREQESIALSDRVGHCLDQATAALSLHDIEMVRELLHDASFALADLRAWLYRMINERRVDPF